MRAQENDRALDQDVEPAQAHAQIEDPNRQLPEDLERRVAALQPGDPQALVTLVRLNPDFIDAILTQAAATAGNQTVSTAIDILMAAPATAAPAARGAAITPDYSVEGFDYDASVLTLEGGDVAGDHVRFITLYPELRHKVLNGLALAHPELLDEAMERLHRLEQARGIEDDEKKDTEQAAADAGSEAPVEAPATQASAQEEAAWIVGAKRYNAAHEDQLEEFNRVTQGVCVGQDGVADPKLISDWQAAHGLQPDGRVGPKTVEAARHAAGIGTPIPMPEGDLGLE